MTKIKLYLNELDFILRSKYKIEIIVLFQSWKIRSFFESS